MDIVRFEGLSKSFGPVRVLTNVSFSLREGEVVALMGENGAGKSTLMKILSGIYPHGSYEGKILFKGEEAHFGAPKEAEEAGVAIIHQELSFFPSLTVAENMVVGHWPTQASMVNWKEVEGFAHEWLKLVGAKCKPQDMMKDLSVGAQQLVEIGKALSRRSRILVLDEPTSALTPVEVENLFKLIRKLKAEGCALVYISHKMEEIFEIADRIVVLRDGSAVGDAPTAQWTKEELIKKMVGRELNALFPEKISHVQKENVLTVRDLTIKKGGRSLVGPISFEVRKGEILGVAGLLGAGRTELLKALYGTPQFDSTGEILLRGKNWKARNPQHALLGKVVYLSEDRKRESLLRKRSLQENLRISELTIKNIFKPLKDSEERLKTQQRLEALKVKFHVQDQDILQLSGGNQQKVILGRILEISPDLVMLDEPTRGVDVGAKFEIYQLLFELSKQGKAQLLVSSELPELLALCDRVLVLRAGKFMGIVERDQMTPENIMSRAFGAVEAAQ